MQQIRFDFPYAEYWIPLLIGMAVGLCAIVVGRIALVRRQPAAPASKEGPENDAFTTCTTTSEQRKTLRRDGNPTPIYMAPPGYKDRPTRAWIVDRSLGGLCLSLSEEVKPGTVLSILPVKAPEMTHWVDIEVKSCRQTNDGWEAGCRFVKPPPFSILMMFG